MIKFYKNLLKFLIITVISSFIIINLNLLFFCEPYFKLIYQMKRIVFFIILFQNNLTTKIKDFFIFIILLTNSITISYLYLFKNVDLFINSIILTLIIFMLIDFLSNNHKINFNDYNNYSIFLYITFYLSIIKLEYSLFFLIISCYIHFVMKKFIMQNHSTEILSDALTFNLLLFLNQEIYYSKLFF